MKIKFPYPGTIQKDYYDSQLYDSNPINPATGKGFYTQHHGGWDIVPLKNGNFWPAPIFPVLSGKLLSASTVDKNRGLGLKVRTVISGESVAYFRAKGLIPQNYNGEVWLEHMYWHFLQVTDVDGMVDQHTQLGLTGNSGYVFAGGIMVPDSQKNVPPYPGAHLHFECVLRSPTTIFNLDKDNIGRFNPEILFAYQGEFDMSNTPGFKKQGNDTVYVQVAGNLVPIADWSAFEKLGGSTETIIELPADQFSKLNVVGSVLFKNN